MKTIVLATNNMGKLREVRSLFDNVEIFSLRDINYTKDIEETGQTFAENALIKAKTIAEEFNITVIADDSGLEVDALNGEPGIYSARYAGGHNDEDNNRLLIKNLQGIDNRKARYVCAICVYKPNGEYKIFEANCEGEIIDNPRGTNGFGYDPYFYVKELSKTFAEVSLEEKNKLSHRAKALRMVKENCDENFNFK